MGPAAVAPYGASVPDILLLALVATATVLATGVGALPVVVLGKARARGAQGLLSGFAAGVMAVAATVGLLLPAFDRGRLDRRARGRRGAGAPALAPRARAPHGRRRAQRGRRALAARARRALRPQPSGGLRDRQRVRVRRGRALRASVIAAIAIQNVPEGTATAAAMAPAGYRPAAQVWVILTSVPQIPGALLAWLAVEQIDGLLAPSFALAGGAMLALVAVDLLPDAWRHAPHARVVAGTVAGALLMLAVGAALDV